MNEALPQGAKKSVYLFLIALVVIVAIAMIPEIRTIGSGKAIFHVAHHPNDDALLWWCNFTRNENESSNRAKWRSI